mmetsp:Transcript_32131/g.79633  ORF Transcript_32131/g.79633 Transcript_32131/m.79633 type:complete len:203 (-) Transcript_32131:246-854(-)
MELGNAQMHHQVQRIVSEPLHRKPDSVARVVAVELPPIVPRDDSEVVCPHLALAAHAGVDSLEGGVCWRPQQVRAVDPVAEEDGLIAVAEDPVPQVEAVTRSEGALLLRPEVGQQPLFEIVDILYRAAVKELALLHALPVPPIPPPHEQDEAGPHQRVDDARQSSHDGDADGRPGDGAVDVEHQHRVHVAVSSLEPAIDLRR